MTNNQERAYTVKELRNIAALYGNIREDLALLGVAKSTIPEENRERLARELLSDHIPRLRTMTDSVTQIVLDLSRLEKQADYYGNLYSQKAKIRAGGTQ